MYQSLENLLVANTKTYLRLIDKIIYLTVRNFRGAKLFNLYQN